MSEEPRGNELGESLARLDELLELELAWCDRLRRLSERQLDLCAGGSSTHLAGVLQERMRCLERLKELEAALAPVARSVRDVGSLCDSDEVERVRRKAMWVDSIVKEVAVLDAECESALRAELESAERELRDLNSQLRVADSYARPASTGAHVVVVRG